MGHTLVLLRHGQSTWNMEDRFTGWSDVDLSERGVAESHHAGQLLALNGFTFDLAFTSVLKRAIRTLWIVMDEMDLLWIPVVRDWRLNERHYGALQGLSKAETAERLGAEKVYLWRRSFAERPPALALGDARHPHFDRRYARLDPEQLPTTESLEDTFKRVMPFWREVIIPQLGQGEKVLIVAHGNSLRALVKYLDRIPDGEINDLNIPTGIPLVYEFDTDLRILERRYLGEPKTVKEAIEATAPPSKAKTREQRKEEHGWRKAD